MSLNLSNWAAVTRGQIVQSLSEGDYLSDNPFQYYYEKGKKQWIFPKFSKRTPINRADKDAAQIGQSNATEPVVTVNTDDPMVIEELVTYQSLNDYGGYIPQGYAQRFGIDFGQGRSDRIAAFIAKTALARAGGKGKVVEAGVTTAANVATAVGKAVALLQNYAVPTANYRMLVKPDPYNLLLQTDFISSQFYTNKKTNDQEQDMIPFRAGRIQPQVSVMGVNWTNATNYPGIPSAYQADFTNVWAILWVPSAVAMLESEKASELTEVFEDKSRHGWCVRTRAQFGMGVSQEEACVVIATS